MSHVVLSRTIRYVKHDPALGCVKGASFHTDTPPVSITATGQCTARRNSGKFYLHRFRSKIKNMVHLEL